jgi:hypothetical protein
MPKRATKTALTKLLRVRIIKPKAFPTGPAFSSDMGTFSRLLDFSGVGLQTRFPWEMKGTYNESAYITLNVCGVLMFPVGRSSNGRRITFAVPDMNYRASNYEHPLTCRWRLHLPAQFEGGAWGTKTVSYTATQIAQFGVKDGPLWPVPKRTSKPSRGRRTADMGKTQAIQRLARGRDIPTHLFRR